MRSPNTRSAAVARTAAARALAVCVLRIARPNASRGVGVAWGRRLCAVSKPLDPPRNTSGHVRNSYRPEPRGHRTEDVGDVSTLTIRSRPSNEWGTKRAAGLRLRRLGGLPTLRRRT